MIQRGRAGLVGRRLRGGGGAARRSTDHIVAACLAARNGTLGIAFLVHDPERADAPCRLPLPVGPPQGLLLLRGGPAEALEDGPAGTRKVQAGRGQLEGRDEHAGF